MESFIDKTDLKWTTKQWLKNGLQLFLILIGYGLVMFINNYLSSKLTKLN